MNRSRGVLSIWQYSRASIELQRFFNQPADGIGSNPMLEYGSAVEYLHVQKHHQILKKNYFDSCALLVVRTSLGLFTGTSDCYNLMFSLRCRAVNEWKKCPSNEQRIVPRQVRMPFECLHFHNLPKKHDKNLNSTIIITFCGNTFALGKFNLLRLDCCVAFQAKLLVETEQPVGFYLYVIRPQLTSRTLYPP